MALRLLAGSLLFTLATFVAGGAPAARAAAETLPAWNPAANAKIAIAPNYTIAPILPIPFGALAIAKLSNGATLRPSGHFLDLRDRSGRIIARFDHAGRTLEPPDRPIDLVVTNSSVLFLGAGHATLMTLPRH